MSGMFKVKIDANVKIRFSKVYVWSFASHKQWEKNERKNTETSEI